MKRVIILSAALILSGCVTHRWVKEGATEQDRNMAETACKAEALRGLPPDYVVNSKTTSKDKKHNSSSTNYSSIDANEIKRGILEKDCMYQKGWSQIDVQN
ncbi:hypothetical protein AB1E22_21075 [Buttiauxella gaviniae]|uniref:Lipoprotein n=1 Tax=Buttiauxella gaviniae TaxID=82990 RepID=A0ABV3P049_9ENTR